MKGYFLTDTGKVRNHNEDAGGIFENAHHQHLAVIADGMGGHNAGDVASKMATSSLHKEWIESGYFSSPDDAEKWLAATVKEINNTIYNHSLENKECQGMGTTLVAVICTPEFITISNIGDSRCYLANELGFKQITEDHSLVNELVRTGQISKEDAEHHPRKNVLLKALGTEENIESDIHSITWETNDRLLLCSDGLSNKFSDDELSEFISDKLLLENVAESLIEVANDRGGEDNISIVLVHYDEGHEEGES